MAFEGIEKIMNSGCSPFFISNALSSMLFGEINKDTQLTNTVEQIAFKKQMNLARQKFEDEKFSSELSFKREMLETGRIFQQIEAKRSFENEKKKIEFNFFESYWPLKIDIHAIWNENIFSKSNANLTVILARYNSPKANNDYSNTCDELERCSEKLHNVTFKHSAWKLAEQVNVNNNIGGIAQNMNVHYIMQGIPTLVISPQIVGDILYFDVSIWSFGKGLGSFHNQSMFSMAYDEKNYDTLKEKIRFTLIAIMGIIRDSFMSIEFQKPPVFPYLLEKEKLSKYPDIQQFILSHYEDLSNQISISADYKVLCNDKEYMAIDNKLKESLTKLSK